MPFAEAALDAFDAGHTEAAQALAGSLVDTIVAGYFGTDRYKYTPNGRTTTTDVYDEFLVREYIAFAPMWQAYQQFRVTNGDKVPTRFSRHATAHTVSARQYSRRNAVQALMFACSLLCRLGEEVDRACFGRRSRSRRLVRTTRRIWPCSPLGCERYISRRSRRRVQRRPDPENHPSCQSFRVSCGVSPTPCAVLTPRPSTAR